MPTEAARTPSLPRALLVVGAGGHGRVVADAALRGGAWSSVHATDRDPSRCVGSLLEGVALWELGAAGLAGGRVHVAIGNNLDRLKESQHWGAQRIVSVLHPLACISPFASVGAGCFVAAHAVLAPTAQIGVGVIVNHGAVVDHDNMVGDFTHIAPGAVLGGDVRVGARVLIGARAVLLPSVRICDDVVVGAGTVVHCSITVPGTYVGVPARRIQ